MADHNKKALVWNMLDFLRTSMADGTVKTDDVEGLEVAIECIGEAFGVDPAAQAEAFSIRPASLQSIFDVFLRTKQGQKMGKPQAAAASAPAAAPAAPAPVTDEQKKQAEALKSEGNSLMSAKSYQAAIDKYTAAIALDGANPVYFSNRAAAFSSLGDHDGAVADAQAAIKTNPAFIKGYSRLGHALYSLGRFPEAVSAYEQGLNLDPTNANFRDSLANARSRLPSSTSGGADDDDSDDDDEAVASRAPPAGGAGAGGMPDLASMASMFGGMGGGAGGMPDMAAMMKNPKLMEMAQSMMANGGLEKLMANPAIRGFADKMQATGKPPSMEELMQSEDLKGLASQFGPK